VDLTLAAPPPLSLTQPSPVARRAAEQNLRRNVAALRVTQSRLEIAADPLNWTFARDGSITVREFGAWWAGNSLPARAAVQQLATLDARGPVSCFLDPPHAAHLRVALDKLTDSQAIMALVPQGRSLSVILGGEDLSTYITGHRLWFVTGDAWPQAMRELFAERPGLATPSQFIRLNLPNPERLDPLISAAREVIASIGAARANEAREITARWTPRKSVQRCCVVTGRRFRLWNDSGLALVETVAGDPSAVALCSDDPLSASTHELLRSATQSDVLLTADFARADLPDLLPAMLPWVTWVTTPRIPSAAAAGPNDRLLLADPAWFDRAIAGGWRKDAIELAGWPEIFPSPGTPGEGRERASASGASCPSPLPNPPPEYRGREAFVALIADTVSLDAPPKLDDFSSHRLLWNTIRDELLHDPLAAGTDAEAYLASRQRKFDVLDESLDRRLFIYGLIEPAITQAIVRRLIADGVQIQIFGRGWDALPEFAAHWKGVVDSRQKFAGIAASVSAILDTRSVAFRDQRHNLGLPVIRAAGRTILAVRQEISAALKGQLASPPAIPPIALSRVMTWAAGEG
jgi:hypothetical protein